MFCFDGRIFSEMGNGHNKNNQVIGDFKVICYPKTSSPKYNLKARKKEDWCHSVIQTLLKNVLHNNRPSKSSGYFQQTNHIIGKNLLKIVLTM